MYSMTNSENLMMVYYDLQSTIEMSRRNFRNGIYKKQFEEMRDAQGLQSAVEWLVKKEREYAYDIEVKMRVLWEKKQPMPVLPQDIVLTKEEIELIELLQSGELFPDAYSLDGNHSLNG